MSMEPSRIGGLARLARKPRELLTSGRGNVELWANLLIIAWAIGFMVWNGVGYAIAVGTVFAIWAILTVSLNLVVGIHGSAVGGTHRVLRRWRVRYGDSHLKH